MYEVYGALIGFLCGGLLIRWLMLRPKRQREHLTQSDPHFESAKRAIVQHVRTHGSANLASVRVLLELPESIAVQYLEHLEQEGYIKAHRHQENGAFYTLS